MVKLQGCNRHSRLGESQFGATYQRHGSHYGVPAKSRFGFETFTQHGQPDANRYVRGETDRYAEYADREPSDRYADRQRPNQRHPYSGRSDQCADRHTHRQHTACQHTRFIALQFIAQIDCKAVYRQYVGHHHRYWFG